MVPGRIVDADAHKPAEQEVVFQPLHQKPFRADRVKRLQQHRPQQLLRRDRRPPDRRIQRREFPLQPPQCLVHNRPNTAQRVIAPHPSLKIHVAEQFARLSVTAPHDSLPPLRGQSESRTWDCREPFFNSLLGPARAAQLDGRCKDVTAIRRPSEQAGPSFNPDDRPYRCRGAEEVRHLAAGTTTRPCGQHGPALHRSLPVGNARLRIKPILHQE